MATVSIKNRFGNVLEVTEEIAQAMIGRMEATLVTGLEPKEEPKEELKPSKKKKEESKEEPKEEEITVTVSE